MNITTRMLIEEADKQGINIIKGTINALDYLYDQVKDKYSRDKNVYLLDTDKIGELVRKEFGWITSGNHQVLERRDGSEIYEGIMTKYADMYIDAWKYFILKDKFSR